MTSTAPFLAAPEIGGWFLQLTPEEAQAERAGLMQVTSGQGGAVVFDTEGDS